MADAASMGIMRIGKRSGLKAVAERLYVGSNPTGPHLGS